MTKGSIDVDLLSPSSALSTDLPDGAGALAASATTTPSSFQPLSPSDSCRGVQGAIPDTSSDGEKRFGAALLSKSPDAPPENQLDPDEKKIFQAVNNGGIHDLSFLKVLIQKLSPNIDETPENAMLSHLTAQEAEVKKAADENFDIRSRLGTLFSRTAGKDDAYKKIKTHDAKRDFRLKWAQGQWSQVKELYKHKLKYKTVDSTVGTYMSLDAIVREEGGFESTTARIAAVKYVTKCLRMGRPWTLWNSFTERCDFLYIRRSNSTILEEAWENYREMQSAKEASSSAAEGAKATSPDAAASPATALPKIPATEPAKEPQQTSAKGKKRAASKGSTEEGAQKQPKAADDESKKLPENKNTLTEASKKPAEKNATAEATAVLIKIRTKLTAVLAASTALQQAIGNESAWAWANNECTVGPLKMAAARLESMMDEFARDVLTGDPRDKMIKKKYGTDVLRMTLHFNKTLPSPLAALETEVQQLRAMHSVRK
jgi:hypothetical protein